MKIIIKNGRLVDPASGLDQVGDLAITSGRISAIGKVPADFAADRSIDATGLIVAPGLVDLAARLREPGHEHEGMLESELAAAAAGGVTSVVCLPDTDPALDEPGLVEMLKLRARKLSRCRLFPLGALTRGLKGETLTEMAELNEAGCIGFSQAEVAIKDTLVLQRAMQYAATFGYTVWLRPQDPWLGKGVAASGSVATRLGLSGVPVSAETIALGTIIELVRATGTRVHLCRISSAAGVDMVRQAKAQGLPITADVSINSLMLTDLDIGYFNPAMRVSPPLRQGRDRDALRAALGHMVAHGGGTIVNISSGAAIRPLEGWSAYCTGKAGMHMLTRAVALENASNGIRIFGFQPGTTDTDMQVKIRASGMNPVSQIPRGDLLPVAIPAAGILYLCTPAADDLNGQETNIRDDAFRSRLNLG